MVSYESGSVTTVVHAKLRKTLEGNAPDAVVWSSGPSTAFPLLPPFLSYSFKNGKRLLFLNNGEHKTA